MVTLCRIGRRFVSDRAGAAMIEYSVLLSIITVAIFLAIVGIASFIAMRWGELGAVLP